jgi:hypothetical protein
MLRSCWSRRLGSYTYLLYEERAQFGQLALYEKIMLNPWKLPPSWELAQANPFIPCPKEGTQCQATSFMLTKREVAGIWHAGRDNSRRRGTDSCAPIGTKAGNGDTEYSVYIKAWNTILRTQSH